MSVPLYLILTSIILIKLVFVSVYFHIMLCIVTGSVNNVGYWKWIMLFSMTTLVSTITIVAINIDYHITEKKGTSCFSVFIN